MEISLTDNNDLADNYDLAIMEEGNLNAREKVLYNIFQLKMLFQRIVDLSKAASYQIEGIIHNRMMKQEKFDKEQMETMRICNGYIEKNNDMINEHIEMIDEDWKSGVGKLIVVNEDVEAQRIRQFMYNFIHLIRLGYENLMYKKMILCSFEQ